jgi:hypothetical protein
MVVVPTDDSSTEPILYTVNSHNTEYVHDYAIHNGDIFSAYVETTLLARGQYPDYFQSFLL